MGKFTIDYTISYTGTVEIEAKNEAEAKRKFDEMYNEPCGDMPIEGEFGTLPCEIYGWDIDGIYEDED